MLQNWKNALDKSESVCALFMDLSNALDTINHDLLLAKLKAHGFSKDALSLMCSYLKKSLKKVAINNSARKFKKLLQEFHKVLWMVLFFSIHL